MKFGNVPTRYGGVLYHSKLEARYAIVLDKLLAQKKIRGYERQVYFKLEVNGVKICSIIPDFLVVTETGQEEIHEVKGKETPDWRKAWRLLQALHPEYRYVLIKEPQVALFETKLREGSLKPFVFR